LVTRHGGVKQIQGPLPHKRVKFLLAIGREVTNRAAGA